MRYKVFKLMEEDEGISGYDGGFETRGIKSKTCITRRLGKNVFGEVNGLNATVPRDSKTLITNLKLTDFLREG